MNIKSKVSMYLIAVITLIFVLNILSVKVVSAEPKDSKIQDEKEKRHKIIAEEKLKYYHPKIDLYLMAVIHYKNKKEIAKMKEIAETHMIKIDNNYVEVMINLVPGIDASTIDEKELINFGATGILKAENIIEAKVPIESLKKMAENITWIRQISPPIYGHECKVEGFENIDSPKATLNKFEPKEYKISLELNNLISIPSEQRGDYCKKYYFEKDLVDNNKIKIAMFIGPVLNAINFKKYGLLEVEETHIIKAVVPIDKLIELSKEPSLIKEIIPASKYKN